eukprot:5467015-Pleurochrysis_carterae.AAC.1
MQQTIEPRAAPGQSPQKSAAPRDTEPRPSPSRQQTVQQAGAYLNAQEQVPMADGQSSFVGNGIGMVPNAGAGMGVGRMPIGAGPQSFFPPGGYAVSQGNGYVPVGAHYLSSS